MGDLCDVREGVNTSFIEQVALPFPHARAQLDSSLRTFVIAMWNNVSMGLWSVVAFPPPVQYIVDLNNFQPSILSLLDDRQVRYTRRIEA